jgi:hypothetical protein
MASSGSSWSFRRQEHFHFDCLPSPEVCL